MSKLATISVSDLDSVTGGSGLDYLDCINSKIQDHNERVRIYQRANPFSSWRSDVAATNRFASKLSDELGMCEWASPAPTPRTDL